MLSSLVKPNRDKQLSKNDLSEQKLPSNRLRVRNKRKVEISDFCIKMCAFCAMVGDQSAVRACMYSCNDEGSKRISCPSYIN
ncbi:hypothetical protein EB796_020335 [Bugula neritina]|uniref:Uncharacterized protein n=1 Tax=Bugula neritina TaxID=10212 RepID=A0A7J7J7F0_BUGNE|nr:hypothetical protein EB796_020335 [Bugula neritina]